MSRNPNAMTIFTNPNRRRRKPEPLADTLARVDARIAEESSRLRAEMDAWLDKGGERPDAVDGLRGSWIEVIGTQGSRGR